MTKYDRVKQDTSNCTTIVVGKDASATGRVILGHNEDDFGNYCQLHWVPRKTHEPGETITFEDGDAVIPEVPETLSYVWVEMRNPDGIAFADEFLNECGVAVVSNSNKPPKINEKELETSTIGYGIRRLTAERAHTAREALFIAAELVEKYGYYSARCYQVADANECWSLQLTTGHYFVAKRVPDDEVYFMPNWHTIHEVDFTDTEHKNYYWTPGIVEYAIENGWYTPAVPGDYSDFDYTAVFQVMGTDKFHCEVRTRNAWRMLGHERTMERPFSYKLDHKVTLDEVKALMRSHNEGSEDYENLRTAERDPHVIDTGPRTICNSSTMDSWVIDFQEDPLLTTLWRAWAEPCTNPYVPFYAGVLGAPAGYEWLDYELAQKTHFHPAANEFKLDPTYAWWTYMLLIWMIQPDYFMAHEIFAPEIEAIEKEWTEEQPAVHKAFEELKKIDVTLAREYLTEYTNSKAAYAWSWAEEMIQKIGVEKYKINNPSARE